MGSRLFEPRTSDQLRMHSAARLCVSLCSNVMASIYIICLLFLKKYKKKNIKKYLKVGWSWDHPWPPQAPPLPINGGVLTYFLCY